MTGRDFYKTWKSTVATIPLDIPERTAIAKKNWFYVSPEMTWDLASDLLCLKTKKYEKEKPDWWLNMWSEFTGQPKSIFIAYNPEDPNNKEDIADDDDDDA